MVRAVLQNLLGIYVGQCWARDGFFSLATRCYKLILELLPSSTLIPLGMLTGCWVIRLECPAQE